MLSVGKIYHVLELYLGDKEPSKYRIINDDRFTLALYPTQLFDVESYVVPSNWRINFEADAYIELTPEEWSAAGFWEEYFDNDPRAVEIFETQRDIILKEDP